MDWLKIRDRITFIVEKYKYFALIALLGLGLLMIPETNSREIENTEPTSSPMEILVAQELESILCNVSGAGKVKVMLSISAGERKLYQTDVKNIGENADSETVILTDSDKNECGLIYQTLPAQYLGAVIVCQGGNDPRVRLAIVEAVSDITGLGADKISVLKMN